MTETRTVVLTGNDLTIEEIVAVGVGDRKVEIESAAMERCRRSRAFLESEVRAGKILYGVNTSFGPMCNKIVRDDEIGALQINLVRSHAAGLGNPIPPYISRGVLVLRLNTLLKGFSGVREELLTALRDMINAGIAPYIPESGSVGASGDLIHLAHMALGLVGEGRVYAGNELTDAKAAFARAGIKPVTLSFKEGLALINGTAAMTSLAAFALFGAEKALRLAHVTAAFAMEIFGGIDDAFDERVHALKPHPGQVAAARTIRRLYHGSANITERGDIHRRIGAERDLAKAVYQSGTNVQDVYSIRCTAQVLAPVVETLAAVRETVRIESNSVNDNPIVIPGEGVFHGGNFHGQSLSFAMDTLAIAVSTLCNLSERRINKLLDKSLNEGLPEHLVAGGEAGLVMGFMGAQYLAVSSTAENRQLANPVSVHSISCNASNQDVVSMGTISARRAFQVVRNAKHVLTLETLCDLQALALRNAAALGHGTGRLRDELSSVFRVYDNRRIMHDDLTAMRRKLFSSPLLSDLTPYLGPA